jgi:hypothetical protein
MQVGRLLVAPLMVGLVAPAGAQARRGSVELRAGAALGWTRTSVAGEASTDLGPLLTGQVGYALSTRTDLTVDVAVQPFKAHNPVADEAFTAVYSLGGLQVGLGASRRVYLRPEVAGLSIVVGIRGVCLLGDLPRGRPRHWGRNPRRPGTRDRGRGICPLLGSRRTVYGASRPRPQRGARWRSAESALNHSGSITHAFSWRALTLPAPPGSCPRRGGDGSDDDATGTDGWRL